MVASAAHRAVPLSAVPHSTGAIVLLINLIPTRQLYDNDIHQRVFTGRFGCIRKLYIRQVTDVELSNFFRRIKRFPKFLKFSQNVLRKKYFIFIWRPQ